MDPQEAWRILNTPLEGAYWRAEARQALIGWLERGGFAPSKADGSPVSLDDVRAVLVPECPVCGAISHGEDEHTVLGRDAYLDFIGEPGNDEAYERYVSGLTPSDGETETAPDPIEITVSSDDIDPDADLGVTLTLVEDTAGRSQCTFHPVGVQRHHGVAYIDIRIDGEYFASGHAVCDGHVYEHVRNLLATVRHLPESVARRMANRVAAAWYSATSL